MGFLDELISTTKNVAASAGKKTDEAVKISKLKIKKSQISGDIKAKNEKLGATMYQMAKSGEKDNEAFDAAVAELDACYEALADVNKQLDELNGMLSCTSCGAKTKNDNSFCPKCGTKLPVIEVAAPAEEAAEEKTEEAAEAPAEEKAE